MSNSTVEISLDILKELILAAKYDAPKDVLEKGTQLIQNQPKLTAFTLFPELPTELRLKIWEIANSAPRIVGLECVEKMVMRKTSCSEHGEHERMNPGVFAIPATCKSPLLETSTEPREVVLRNSIPLLTRSEKGYLKKMAPPNVRFNMDRDILWVMDTLGLHRFCNGYNFDIEATTRVAIYDHMWPGWMGDFVGHMQILLPFLEELYLVVGSEVDFRNTNVKLIEPLRRPWRYTLKGFGVEDVKPTTTWKEMKGMAQERLEELVWDREEFRELELGIDPEDSNVETDGDDGDDVDVDPDYDFEPDTCSLLPMLELEIKYVEIVAADQQWNTEPLRSPGPKTLPMGVERQGDLKELRHKGSILGYFTPIAK
ncbi:hypothetical protein BJ878DRAFT_554610 [Calycina marina]|uniref:2EXR domain-containing protein n=1 Tax=Calycina marina TaxID=1763456 RepID=A0A9P7YZV0_9HELO|nr:hypothetical protein BJ878DRAFT_554610 [Calycina marina]